MVSVPDWTNGGYAFPGARRFSVRALVRRIKGAFRWLTGRSRPAPVVSKSMIYLLCEEYRRFDLWAAYHAFRLDPQAHNWQRLRRRNVPWQSGLTVEGLLHRLCPLSDKRTPDPTTVGLALVTASFSAPGSAKKKR
jgi:hypothetical protein